METLRSVEESSATSHVHQQVGRSVGVKERVALDRDNVRTKHTSRAFSPVPSPMARKSLVDDVVIAQRTAPRRLVLR